MSILDKKGKVANDVIEECKNQVKKRGAPYISRFISHIEGQIIESSDRKERDAVLTKYVNKDTFVSTLDKYLRLSLFGYLGMVEADE